MGTVCGKPAARVASYEKFEAMAIANRAMIAVSTYTVIPSVKPVARSYARCMLMQAPYDNFVICLVDYEVAYYCNHDFCTPPSFDFAMRSPKTTISSCYEDHDHDSFGC